MDRQRAGNSGRSQAAAKTARKSVAKELISALTKPKVKETLKEVKQERVVKEKVEEKVSVKQEKMDDFAKMVFGREAKRPPKAGGASALSGPSKNPPSTSKPPPANDDWINFLKKKQDVPRSSELDVLKVGKMGGRHQDPTNLAKSMQMPTDPDKLNTSEKDVVLKNLLQQVSDLEATMGDSISKLEGQLKAEQEKCIKLKIRLDDEKEGGAEMAAKVDNSEKALKAVNEELKEEKGLNIELFDKTISLEQSSTEDKSKLAKITSELKSEKLSREKLERKVDALNKWKAECIVKVKSSQEMCTSTHVTKIAGLEEKLVRQAGMLEEVVDKVPAMVENFNSKLKGDGGKSLVAMDEKVKVAEVKLKKVEEESRAKEADMHKVYDLVNRLQKQIKDLKVAAENTRGSKRKAEEEGEDHPGSSPAKKTLVTSDDSDDDVECLTIAKNISKEAEIKEALRMMITKPAKVDLGEKSAKKVDLEEKIISEPNPGSPPVKLLVKCPVEEEAIRNLDEVKLKANSDQHKTVEIDQRDIDQSVEANESKLEADTEESKTEIAGEVVNNVAPPTDMESESTEEATVVLEEKDLNLEMSWQLKKWPNLPSLLNRQKSINFPLPAWSSDPRLQNQFNIPPPPPPRLLKITFVAPTEEEAEEMNNGKCVEMGEEEEDTEKEESVNEGKEDDTAEQKEEEGDVKEEENVKEKEKVEEECALQETLTEDEGLGKSETETALIFKGEKLGEESENKFDERQEGCEEDVDESDVLEEDLEEDLDAVKGDPLEEQKAEILNNDLNSDDEDDDDEAEGKLVISEDSDGEEEEDMPAAKKVKLGDEIAESNDLTAVESEHGEKIQTEASEDGEEKAAVFGFRFVNECLDEEAFEMEEAVVAADADDDHADVEVPVEVEQIDTDEVETLEKYKIHENTMEENVEMEENDEDKDEVEEELADKVPEVIIEKREKLLENVEEDEDEELSTESLASRWQRKKGKRFGQKSLSKGENSNSSKRPRRSCQQVKGYFRK